MEERRHPQRDRQASGDGEASFRLPLNYLPRRYDLRLAPRPAAGSFVGGASVTVEVATPLPAPTRSLTMHALELAIEPADVSVRPPPHRRAEAAEETPEADTARLQCVAVRSSPAAETITLDFAACLPNVAGDTFVVDIARFTGHIYDSVASCGLFYSNSHDTNFLSTHLEPTNARLLFPCFDEPAYRAVFQLTVEFDSRYTVVAGTRAVREELVAVDEDVFGARFCDPPPSPARDASKSASFTGGGYSVRGDSLGAAPANARDGDELGATERMAGSGASASLSTAPPLRGVRGRAASAAAAEDDVPTAAGPQEGRSCPHWRRRNCDPLEDAASDSPTCLVRRVFFADTPLLCTCAVGFNIGRFYIREETTPDRLLCRVIIPAEVQVNYGWYALDLLTKAVAFFDDYFAFRLPLQKLDLVCLRCCGFLAMENWGMISMHLDYMLVNESTPLERRQRIARLIGHMVARQWVGNSAAIAWWSSLWIREGVCGYLSFTFVDSVYPNWLMWEAFLTQVLDDALVLDSQPEKTHPLQCCNATQGTWRTTSTPSALAKGRRSFVCSPS
ncbi:puromycin-sensitive aminopeptidase-like protein [Trypanosoma conorhini]|uniref:Puromycin-sensitive aminopeptidase-like protein n=1 Tax=Trypanosoma conorhini TaxID=83891 RepID=A0A3R7PJS4_9TRYP|nr:puromycin-sensitive aminopeptidase-like protein [Trypanosoma conorhini]RNF26358.1 puromycin-sensitive aminopeptidase-like protein [Trypanosoma conorhini]